ncbi:ABC transporter ATP-binding protein [Actinocorallia populi]|uniref:ABC transporter ATP-binding protein n=1 Tax=Actinocorallia populi TaxID=2079200 RepID=UPI001E398F0F|nr:ABC transporter ATP-binding protein [Actinocorallia populi]
MTDEAIRTERLGKHFGKTVALEGLDLVVPRGEVFGFLGPNGAGKSTTIRLLLNLIRPTSGHAWIMGVPVGDVRAAHRHLGYVPGDVALWPQLTGMEILTYLGRLAGRVDTAYRDELVERLRLDTSLRARSYSKGNRQKVALVAAFMTRPDLLLLDEPTAGLDPLMEAEFQALTREAAARGQTVFLSSHILAEVEDVCERVGILRDGRLIEVATLADLRGLNATVYDATLEGPTPDLSDVPGVTSAEPLPDGVRVTVAGSPVPLLERLTRAGLLKLRSHEPSLEEVFMTYYAPPAQPETGLSARLDG